MTARRLWPASVVALALVLSGCGTELPQPSSQQAHDAARLWKIALVAAAVVGGVTMALILWSAFRFRRRSDDLPDQRSSHLTLEVVCTAIPVAIVAGLFAFTVGTERRMTRLSADPPVVVDVIGYQWGWQFVYAREGVTSIPPAVGEPAVLALPVGTTVRLNLRSPDVIHSFWVPQLLEKRDVIPGVDNAIDVDVTRTGTWTGRCAEFCGLDHWRMNFEVRALSFDDYRDWLAEQLAKQRGGGE
jgi:cytochrome c oxidase subunit 2